MNLEQYLKRKQEIRAGAPAYRDKCRRCKKSQATCYCGELRPFASTPLFVILIHRNEHRRGIATGRMTHLSLSNSVLIEGTDFTFNTTLNQILRDQRNHCVILAPGQDSKNLSEMKHEERAVVFPNDKLPVVIVIDGTWAQARQMKRLSRNLHDLPSICFTPNSPSQFRVRKQPASFCYSTIEAVHECLRLFNPNPHEPRENLLKVFAYMVNQQLKYEVANGARNELGLPVRATRGARLSGPS